MNGLRFVNLYIDGCLAGSQLVKFAADGRNSYDVVMTNEDGIVFPMTKKVKGTPSIHIQGAVLEMSVDYVKVKKGDTITMSPGALTVKLVS